MSNRGCAAACLNSSSFLRVQQMRPGILSFFSSHIPFISHHRFWRHVRYFNRSHVRFRPRQVNDAAVIGRNQILQTVNSAIGLAGLLLYFAGVASRPVILKSVILLMVTDAGVRCRAAESYFGARGRRRPAPCHFRVIQF
jgi:hypothetical protein